MAIKAIVCDMDGTLLTAEHKIPPKTYKKLIDLQKRGIKLILASGRSYKRLIPDALKLKMDENAGILIDVNGTSIYHVMTGERERISILNHTNIQEINNFFSLFNVELQYSQDDTIYTYLPDSIYKLKQNIRGEMKLPEDYPWTGGMYSWLCDMRDGYPNQILIRDLKDAPEHCNKISVVQDPLYINFVHESIMDHPIYNKYEFVFSDERKMEITKKGTTKGRALDIILERYDIKHDEVVVFGDSENDISMFMGKKYSIAMNNALPKAKHSANFITDSNNEEGIYNMLIRLEKEGLFA